MMTMGLHRVDSMDHGGQTSTLITTYSRETNSFRTRLDSNARVEENNTGQFHTQLENNNKQAEIPRRDSLLRRRRDSLMQYISHAFALGTKTNYVFAYILGVNLVMSILNTFLLSFVVKSLQANERGLFDGKYLVLSKGHLGDTHLELPAFVSRDKSISSELIEQVNWATDKNERPLIVEDWPGADARDGGEILISGSSESDWPPNKSADSRAKSGHDGELAVAGDEKGQNGDRHNYIRLTSGRERYLSSTSNKYGKDQVDKRRLARRSGVEIVTNSLVLNLLPAASQPFVKKSNRKRTAAGHLLERGVAFKTNINRHQLGSAQRHHQVADTGASPVASTLHIRRLLEFDGEQQSITLPLLSKFNLFSATKVSSLGADIGQQQAKDISTTTSTTTAARSKAHLIVNGQLNCGGELSGTLEEHFDVQSRANLTCRSEQELRIVSKSGGLNLVASEQLKLIAPQVKFAAPKTNKLYLLNGIEWYDVEENHNEKMEITVSSQAPPSSSEHQNLQAFNLMLADGILMAASQEDASV